MFAVIPTCCVCLVPSLRYVLLGYVNSAQPYCHRGAVNIGFVPVLVHTFLGQRNQRQKHSKLGELISIFLWMPNQVEITADVVFFFFFFSYEVQ